MGRGRRYDNEPKLNIKKVFIVLIAIAVIIMIGISFSKLLSKEGKSTENTDIGLEYFAVYTNQKWGVIDSTGKQVINSTYEEMIIIPDSKKDIFLCTYEMDPTTQTYKTKAINKKNETLYNTYESIEGIDNYDTQNTLWYEKDVLKVKKDGKYGLIDFKGKELLGCYYDKITSMKGITNSLILEKDGKLGLANNLGEIIIPAEYKEIKPLGTKYEQGYIVINENNQYGVIDANKKVILQPEYAEIKNVSGNGMYVVKTDKLKILNKDKEIILDTGFEDIAEINGNNITIISGGKYGVMDIEGNTKLKPEYEKLQYSFGENYIAKQNGKYGVINIAGEKKVDYIYANLIYRNDASFFEAEKENEYTTTIIDRNFAVKSTGILSEVNVENGYMKIRVEGEYKYYNFKFEEKTNKDVLTARTLYLVKKDGKYGYQDKSGNTVVEPIYEDAIEQNRFGFSAIKKDGKWGCIDKTGKIILEPTLSLEESLIVDFIGTYHLGQDINMNYYTDK